MGWFAKVPCRRVTAYTKQVPRYHRDTKNIPNPNLEDRCKVATKCELKRIVNDINHPNQIFLTKPNTSHGYNLRSIPGSVEIPKSGTQRHTCTNLSLAKAVRLLLL